MPGFDIALLSASFVTFFVVIDPIGVAPIFGALTEGSSAKHRRAMAIKSVLIATGVLLMFAYLGEWLLDAMHISLDAFRAAGGVLLFMIALDMIFEKRTERREERAEKMSHEDGTPVGTEEDISVFPMAIPMLAGPGAIASIMLFMSGDGGTAGGQLAILAGLGGNLLACLVIFLTVGPLMRLMGDTLAAMITRILGVILAALAAQFIFDGIAGALL
ncbi:MAG: MarC family transcriptional regulator [Maricaulis sp.]|jgi:multiple antibiotic resistance protein|nr:MarC family transcriptional regulator [Maricaulis sp.]HAQ34031.1 MarC family transcriptional regulator [Alphaproteobacteria bacterium]